MTPTNLIKNWLDQQPESMRTQLAALILIRHTSLEEASDDPGSKLMEWLTPDAEQPLLVAGRALTFRETLKYAVGPRFTEEGWEEAERSQQRTLDRLGDFVPPERAESMRQTLQRQINSLPDKKAAWLALGESWRAFEPEISDARLRQWEHAASSRVRE